MAIEREEPTAIKPEEWGEELGAPLPRRMRPIWPAAAVGAGALCPCARGRRWGARSSWSYCYSCQSHVPPRCGHCYSCNVCVLRRDHHCTLLGQCLGHRNYRYFLCLLLYGSAALLYGCLLNVGVVVSLLQEASRAQMILLLIVPWLMLLTGQVGITPFIYAFVTDVCLVGFLFCMGFLLFHSLLALRGQTTKEWFEESRQYDLGWQGNLREVLGERWPLAWLLPFVASPLPGDGISFRTKGPAPEPLPKARGL
ncbi:probable palmitoyltransferase ZDHHC24 isoform X2 [Hemicordylus capensis]|uniref:probable palmitoyltransferase ZDHHC24 isoform X2 n=1 Tax=Hemicordylus capensis TaxID=884348 RepID=UPI002303A7B8|nr:probable palmitoyltransferase ZDHHC24 isoform X2 [Hemicordylus capensis]